MVPVNCQTHDDCIRACIATITGLPDVPHVFNKDKPAVESWQELRAYLRQHGKQLALFNVDCPFDGMAVNNPDVTYMLMGRTAAGAHAVVCRNGVIVHDPAVIKREMVDGVAGLGWVVGVIL